MKKIGVAGLQREQIKKTIEATAPGCFEVFIHNDMEAAMKVKSDNWITTSARVIPVRAQPCRLLSR